MKTITEIKQHFSDNEIKLLCDIIKGKLDKSILEEEVSNFYEEDLLCDKTLDEKFEILESEFDFWGLV